MFQPARYGGSRRQMPKPIEALAMITSFLGMVFFAPYIWPAIRQPTMLWLHGLYGGDAASLIGFAIRLGTFPAAYFGFRLSISALYGALIMFIASRL